MNKIQQVGVVECTVLKTQQPPQIVFAVMYDKIIRRIVHPLQNLFRLVYNGSPISPGKYGSKQGGNFNVLLFTERVRNTNRVIFNKGRCIVFFHFAVEKRFQLIRHGGKGNSLVVKYRSTQGSCPSFARLWWPGRAQRATDFRRATEIDS